jgi:hypothetical protein
MTINTYFLPENFVGPPDYAGTLFNQFTKDHDDRMDKPKKTKAVPANDLYKHYIAKTTKRPSSRNNKVTLRLKNEMKVFLDIDGTPIKAGDVLYREFYIRWRERPGGRRVAINGMSGSESIVNDEGGLLERKKCWITRKVGWMGACLVAERLEYSDFQDLMQGEAFDGDDKEVYEQSATFNMGIAFESERYKIVSREVDQELAKPTFLDYAKEYAYFGSISQSMIVELSVLEKFGEK